jgi:hypothetical protein
MNGKPDFCDTYVLMVSGKCIEAINLVGHSLFPNETYNMEAEA